jgi:hypothetical protein
VAQEGGNISREKMFSTEQRRSKIETIFATMAIDLSIVTLKNGLVGIWFNHRKERLTIIIITDESNEKVPLGDTGYKSRCPHCHEFRCRASALLRDNHCKSGDPCCP